MKSIILGLPGLDNQPPQAQLQDEWRQAIAEGLAKNGAVTNPEVPFALVYWADLLYKYPLHDDANFSFDPLYNQHPYRPAQSGALRPYRDSWLETLQRGSFDLLGKTSASLRLRFEVEVFSNARLSSLLRELHLYYDGDRFIPNRQGQPDLARHVLRAELHQALQRHRGQRICLVTHAMGSLIAYDALRDLGQHDPDLSVSHFITLGSPLGLPYVKTKILRERGYDPSLRTPSLVQDQWVNYADRRDAIALETHLADDYTANCQAVQVQDTLIANDAVLRDGQPDYHNLYGYLRTPEFSHVVQTFLYPEARNDAP